MEAKIRDYKCMDNQNIIKSIVIRNKDEEICAYLCPVTKMIFEYPLYVEKLVEWRQDNPTVSNNYFLVTMEGTRKWLQKVILEDEHKIFFLLFSYSGVPIGQMGLSNINIDKGSAFIYAVIKGDKSVKGGIMEAALSGMISWSKQEFNIENYYLDVQETNDRAIRLYEKIGFKKISKIPLEKRVSETEVNWVISTRSQAERYDIRMKYEERED